MITRISLRATININRCNKIIYFKTFLWSIANLQKLYPYSNYFFKENTGKNFVSICFWEWYVWCKLSNLKLFARTKFCEFQKKLQKMLLSQISTGRVITIITINFLLIRLVLHLLLKSNP